jgi:ATP-dependent DNA ligase
MKLYRKTKTGKTEMLEITTDGAKMVSEWGELDGKRLKSVKVCKPMNKGKANARTAAEQAVAEMTSKITLKRKEGYSDKMPKAGATIVGGKVNLDMLPKNFCPNKPISDAPKSIMEHPEAFAQRKHDGHCVFLVKGYVKSHVYSRRMEDITDACMGIPIIRDMLNKMRSGDFLMTEFVYYDNKLKKEIAKKAGSVARTQSADEALTKYMEYSKSGTFTLIPFDLLFHHGVFIGNQDYRTVRYAALQAMKFPNVPPVLPWGSVDVIASAQALRWEGFVLRVPGEKSHIGYTMDGKAHRKGAYKWKFTKTEDFVVDEVLKGISGEHSKFYAKFHTIQYGPKGEIIDRGYVGPGTLSHDELRELTREIDSQKRKVPFVVEIEYQSIHDDTGKLQFGVIQRLRDDKAPGECVSED